MANTNTTISLPNLFSHTPKWASSVMTILSFCYLLNGGCQLYDLYKLPEPIQHKVDGIYGIGTLVLLSFGAKKPTDATK